MNTKLLEELCDVQGVAGYEEKAQDIAVKAGIPHHDNWHGGTDAHQMQKQGKGAHVTTIGVPSAFMHWANGLADLRDIQATTDLLARFAENAHDMGASTNPWTRLSA